MPQIIFEERAVAFIDILGFRSIVKQAITEAAAHNELQDLVDQLGAAIPSLDASVSGKVPKRLFPVHTYISDCIILSAPIGDPEHEFLSYDGLSVVVMRAIQLSHRFLTAGYLLRGGISIGKVWHQSSNIVGPAYQNAYCLERKTEQPRIELDEAAEGRWNNHSNRLGGRMCRAYDDRLMVNGLHEAYASLNAQREVSAAYDLYAATIGKMITDKNLEDRAKKKWQWFDSYFRDERQQSGF